MTRRHLILWIRFTELALALFALSWLIPRPFDFLPWMLIGLMFNPSLLGTASGCPSDCSSINATISITVAGIANGSCANCTDHNRTTIVTNMITTCSGTRIDGSSSCCFPGRGQALVSASFGNDGSGNTKLNADLLIPSTLSGVGDDGVQADTGGTLGARPIDCTAIGTPTLTVSSFNSNVCDMSAASLTATV
jgi:hypothetical protein